MRHINSALKSTYFARLLYSTKLYAPKTYAPKPYAPKPYAANTYAQKPHAPKPHAPKPHAPKPYGPKPNAPETYVCSLPPREVKEKGKGKCYVFEKQMVYQPICSLPPS